MSDGPKLSGQQYDPAEGVLHPFTEQNMDYSGPESLRITGVEAQANTEIIPVDRSAAKVRVFDLAGIQAVLDAYVEKIPGFATNLPLPDVCTALTITYNNSAAAGSSSHPSSQQSFGFAGTSISGGYNPTASAQGSGSVQPDILPHIKQYWSQKVPTINYFFYMPKSTTIAAILTKLGTATFANATVNSLPAFRPESLEFTLKGASVSVKADADSHASFSGTETSYKVAYEWGNGGSKEVGLTTTTRTISPTLHGAISISGATSDTATGTATVVASTPSVVLGMVTLLAGITNAPTATSATATASVYPTTVSATSPTGIPTSGLYLVDLNIGDLSFARRLYHAEVADFSFFA